MLGELSQTPEFSDWSWDLATRMRAEMEACYFKGKGEVDCVSAIVNAINATTVITSAQVTDAEITVEGAFLHGSKSQVKFSIGGNQQQRELADLLILGSYVENGSLRWQRACFIQAKKGSLSKGSTPSRFVIDEWQLALLRSFPEFEGVSGLFNKKKHHLRNRTGMLGAYGLLSAPGEITVLSARVLNHILGGRKSIVLKELTPTILSERTGMEVIPKTNPLLWWPFDPEHCPECDYLFDRFFSIPHHRLSHIHGTKPGNLSLFPDRGPEYSSVSKLSCLGFDELIDFWTSLRLGEPWIVGTRNRGDLGLQKIIWAIVSQIKEKTDDLSNLHSIMSKIENGNVQPKNTEDMKVDISECGLGVISAVASIGVAGERQ